MTKLPDQEEVTRIEREAEKEFPEIWNLAVLAFDGDKARAIAWLRLAVAQEKLERGR
jgi:hypothetical protein